GMGIRYGDHKLIGTRMFDFLVHDRGETTRLYSLLDYAKFTLLVFSENEVKITPPPFVKVLHIRPEKTSDGLGAEGSPYANQILLVRPDSYIAMAAPLEDLALIV